MLLRKKIMVKFKYRLAFVFTLSMVAIFTYYSFKSAVVVGTIPVLVWLAKWSEYDRTINNCGQHTCEIVVQSKLKENDDIRAYIFYGSDFDRGNLPLPRKSDKIIWALLHEESPRNRPVLMHEKALNIFNYSSTFSRYSDAPLTLLYLDGHDDIISDKHFLNTTEKNRLLDDISPILYLQSDCNTMSDRDKYVEELMKHIKVDSYGDCLNNKELPIELKGNYLDILDLTDFLRFVARYKFTISFENGVCDDYITEKLWRPIQVGSVPIYLGSPTIRDWLPNPKSAIIADDFATPQDLANFLLGLNENDARYEEYLIHKLRKEISNENLLQMLQRKEDFEDLYGANSITAFECFICEKVHLMTSGDLNKSSVVKKSHYDCPMPVSPLTKAEDKGNWWLSHWKDQKLEAELVYKEVFEWSDRKGL